jgi:hypothetical protein
MERKCSDVLQEKFKNITTRNKETIDEENVEKENIMAKEKIDEETVELNKNRPEEEIVKLMLYKPDGFIRKLSKEIGKLSNVNVFHNWQNVYCNLLFHASWLDCPQAIQPLLKNGGDPTLTNNKGVSVLHFMAKRGQLEMAKMCYSTVSHKKKTSFINVTASDGWTPLMSAAETNQLSFMKWLLSKNAKVNLTTRTGWTAMHSAAKNNNWEVLKIMLMKGGNKNIQAAHRDFGRNLCVEDVTVDKKTLKILREY